MHHLLQDKTTNNIQLIVDLTEKTEVLKIDEIIPLFDPNLKIEIFKGNICQQLKVYSQEIDNLKQEMDSLANQSNEWNKELAMMKGNYFQFDSHHKCEICEKYLLGSIFYIFPCLHGYHRNCLLQELINLKVINFEKLSDLDKIDTKMKQIQESLSLSKIDRQGGLQRGRTKCNFSFRPATFHIWHGNARARL